MDGLYVMSNINPSTETHMQWCCGSVRLTVFRVHADNICSAAKALSTWELYASAGSRHRGGHEARTTGQGV